MAMVRDCLGGMCPGTVGAVTHFHRAELALWNTLMCELALQIIRMFRVYLRWQGATVEMVESTSDEVCTADRSTVRNGKATTSSTRSWCEGFIDYPSRHVERSPS